MKILSKEEVKTVLITNIVETEEGNVVVKETFELNDNGTAGKFIDDQIIWEKDGVSLDEDSGNYDLIDDIMVFISQNKT